MELVFASMDDAVHAGSGKSKGDLVLSDQVLPPNLLVLAVNGPVVYPTLLAPILVVSSKQVALVEEVLIRQRTLGIVLTSSQGADAVNPEDAGSKDIYSVGIVAKIIKRLKMPDGSVNLLIHSMKRFRTKRVIAETPYIVVEPEYLEDVVEKSNEMDALSRSVISQVKKLSESNPFFTDEMRLAMINAPGPGVVSDLVAFALSLPKEDAQKFLETLEVKARFHMLLMHLRKEQDLADIQRKINDDVNNKINKLQREFFLKEQMRAIKRELGVEEEGKEKSARTYREKIEAAGMPDDVKKVVFEELEKFETIVETSPEYNVARNYLDLLCALPWKEQTADNLDLAHARKVLNDEHYGLEKVKERIIEFLAVRRLKKNPKGSIICLVGPPGVGKTSIGKSIAHALGRKFYRFSLGGMRDEAEIKGHRRTYIGAMPGKILQGLKRSGSKNAVFMLDEIDKLGQSYQGDPASALLEVLDPEQNHSFVDHFADVPFDLSKVLFVVTANTTSTIPAPLLDRMEVIELSGYTLEEKEKIATRYVVPKELDANGLSSKNIKFEPAALRKLMIDYAREPGLRTLQQCVGKIARKAAAQIVDAKPGKKKPPLIVRSEDLVKWLGPKRFTNEIAERIVSPGVVVGLAWTALGGEILFIEAADLPGSGNLKLTGNMGEVMTESASLAWSFVKKKCGKELGFSKDYFKNIDVHLHIPSGAIPKDGPSAGITMATALYSLMSGRKARHRVAMTGELSLIGKVLPIGGLKEKILAARRAGIRTIIVPEANRKDMVEVPAYATAGLEIQFVNHVDEVFKLALEEKKSTKNIVEKIKKNPVLNSEKWSKKKTASKHAKFVN